MKHPNVTLYVSTTVQLGKVACEQNCALRNSYLATAYLLCRVFATGNNETAYYMYCTFLMVTS